MLAGIANGAAAVAGGASGDAVDSRRLSGVLRVALSCPRSRWRTGSDRSSPDSNWTAKEKRGLIRRVRLSGPAAVPWVSWVPWR